MYNSLKNQLLASGLAALALLVLGVNFASHGYMRSAITIIIIMMAYIVALNLWFWHFVTNPIDALTEFARRIAAGSYGSKT